MASRPLVLPECFNGEKSWDDWKLQFEDVGSGTAAQKLKWFRMRLITLTGQAQKVFHRLPPEKLVSYDGAMRALKR